MTPETAALLQAGKLSQTCPCGITEAASSYCTRCLRPMGEADWYRAEASEAQRAALARSRGAGFGQSGRPEGRVRDSMPAQPGLGLS